MKSLKLKILEHAIYLVAIPVAVVYNVVDATVKVVVGKKK